MGRFSKHLSQGNTVVIEGETYQLKSIGTSYLPHFMRISQDISKAPKDVKDEEIMQYLTTTSINDFKDILEQTLKLSFPDEWKEDETEVKAFGLKFMSFLMEPIMKMNSYQSKTDDQKRVMKIKNRLAPSKDE